MSEMLEIAKKAQEVSRQLADLSLEERNKALANIADELKERSSFLLQENAKDLLAGEEKGIGKALLDLGDLPLHEVENGNLSSQQRSHDIAVVAILSRFFPRRLYERNHFITSKLTVCHAFTSLVSTDPFLKRQLKQVDCRN